MKHSSINCFSLPKKKLTTKDQETIFLRRGSFADPKGWKNLSGAFQGSWTWASLLAFASPLLLLFWRKQPGNYKVTQYGNIWCCRPQTSVFLLGSCLGCRYQQHLPRSKHPSRGPQNLNSSKLMKAKRRQQIENTLWDDTNPVCQKMESMAIARLSLWRVRVDFHPLGALKLREGCHLSQSRDEDLNICISRHSRLDHLGIIFSNLWLTFW